MSQYGIIMPQAPAHFTHPRLQIRTAQDAHRIFEAVRVGLLPLIRRRLSPSERDLLASGQVFVWEEAPTGSAAGDEASQTTSGLERWTDGRRWSQSRMREPFLFYEEKIQTTAEERQAKADRRARKQHSQSGSPTPPSSQVDSTSPTSQSGQTSDSQTGSSKTALLPIRRQDRPTKPDGLTKQTYSSYVYSPSHPNRQPRKWHCVAYFSATDYNHLPSIDAYPELRNIAVPDGVYISAKGTGKTGAPPLMGMPLGSIPAVNGTGHSGSGLSPIGGHQSIVNGINGNGNGVGPIRRPVSRGEQSSSPYPQSKGRAESFGSSSDASSSSHLRSPVSNYSYDSPYDRHPPSSYPNPSPSPREGPEGYRYSSSTSSQSTGSGSPPTPGFMGPISNSASFVPSPHQQYSHQQHHARPHYDHHHDRHRSHRDRDMDWDKDTIMVDAPTLRTPTKEYPRHQQSNQGYFGDVYNPSHHSKRDRAGSSAGSTTPSSAANGSGPILPGINTLTSSAGSATRSKEDSKALGAFKISF